MAPVTLARGYRLAFGGRDPHRDPERRASRAYTERELQLALRALERPCQSERLQEIWLGTLERLQLPSTRMLLRQKARLVLLVDGTAVVEVASHWLPMVRSRLQLLLEALSAELGYPAGLILQGVGQ
jgi:hypothetical protein